jgi:hypothetical protein
MNALVILLLVFLPGLDEHLVLGPPEPDGRQAIYLYDEDLANPRQIGWFLD